MTIGVGRFVSMQSHADFRSALPVEAFEVAHRMARRHGKERQYAKKDHATAQSQPAFFSCKYVEHLNLLARFAVQSL